MRLNFKKANNKSGSTQTRCIGLIFVLIPDPPIKRPKKIEKGNSKYEGIPHKK